MDKLFDKDSKEYKIKNLKSNFLYFDKNHENVLRHKNWWKGNK